MNPSLSRAATLCAGTREEGLAALSAAAVRRFRCGYHFVPYPLTSLTREMPMDSL